MSYEEFRARRNAILHELAAPLIADGSATEEGFWYALDVSDDPQHPLHELTAIAQDLEHVGIAHAFAHVLYELHERDADKTRESLCAMVNFQRRLVARARKR